MPNIHLPYLVTRLAEMLSYAVNCESEEIEIEITIKGAEWEEDERTDLDDDENPDGMFNGRSLGDFGTLETEEFTTVDDRCRLGVDAISKEDIKTLIKLLTPEH